MSDEQRVDTNEEPETEAHKVVSMNEEPEDGDEVEAHMRADQRIDSRTDARVD